MTVTFVELVLAHNLPWVREWYSSQQWTLVWLSLLACFKTVIYSRFFYVAVLVSSIATGRISYISSLCGGGLVSVSFKTTNLDSARIENFFSCTELAFKFIKTMLINSVSKSSNLSRLQSTISGKTSRCATKYNKHGLNAGNGPKLSSLTSMETSFIMAPGNLYISLTSNTLNTTKNLSYSEHRHRKHPQS